MLRHEYVHFRIHDICGGRWLPRWYDEGLAQVLSKGIRPVDLAFLEPLKHKCRHIWALADAAFSSAHDDHAMAYLQSYAVLCYLVRQFGEQKAILVLTHMADSGVDFPTSLDASLGLSVEELDRQWWSILPSAG